VHHRVLQPPSRTVLDITVDQVAAAFDLVEGMIAP